MSHRNRGVNCLSRRKDADLVVEWLKWVRNLVYVFVCISMYYTALVAEPKASKVSPF
jgi:hypothetical protein